MISISYSAKSSQHGGHGNTFQVLGREDDGAKVMVLDESAYLGRNLDIIRHVHARKMALLRSPESYANLCAIPAHQEHLTDGPTIRHCQLGVPSLDTGSGPEPRPVPSI